MTALLKINKPLFRTLLFLLVLCVLFIVSCTKPIRERWVYYDETYCANPWPVNNTNEILKQNIVDYFKAKGIDIYDIEIFSDRTPEACPGTCDCKSGRRVKCKVAKRDVDDMKANGFYE